MEEQEFNQANPGDPFQETPEQIDMKPDTTGIDWKNYMKRRLSDQQIKSSTTLVYDDVDMEREAKDLLEDCAMYWDQLRPFRDQRARAVNYYSGKQWSDKVLDPDTNQWITEGEMIRNQGKVPLVQNQIRQIMKNLLGQFRDNDNTSIVISRKRESAKVGEMLSNTLNYALQVNKAKELDVRQFEEFLLSGMFGWKSSYGWHKNRNIDDVVIDAVSPARVFFNTGISDIRLKEIHTIGELMEVRIEDLISQFAKNDADEQLIRDWYGMAGSERRQAYNTKAQDSSMINNLDFYLSDDVSMCKVIEIWKQKLEKVIIVHDHLTGEVYEADISIEEIEATNQSRLESGLQYGVPEENIPLMEHEEKYENIWYFWFLTPWGNIIQHGKTPFDHEETPYTLGIYPLIDGNIFGLVNDIIDQQRQINRLLTLYDFILAFSAKGVLLIPEDVIPEGMTEDDFADEWVRFNGVITYKPSTKHNQLPQQITANSQNTGLMDMLNMQFSLLKEISGVTDAMQGHKPASGTPSSLYAQQTHNASLSNRDFFEFFFSRKKERDFKIVKTAQQFYEDERYVNIGGKDYNDEVDYYRPELAKDAEFEMTMGQSTTSSAYRTMIDDYLMRFLDAQHIDFSTFLANTSMPFADKLRESIMAKEQEMQQMQQQMAQQGGGGGAAEATNPEAMQLFDQMMGRPQQVPGQTRQPQRGAA